MVRLCSYQHRGELSGKAAWAGPKEQKQKRRRRKRRAGSGGSDSVRVHDPDVMMLLVQAEQRVHAGKNSFNSVLFHIFSFKNNINHKWWFKYYCVNTHFFSFWREELKPFLVSIMDKCIFRWFNNQFVSYNNSNLISNNNNFQH